jgi:hypothetical protein
VTYTAPKPITVALRFKPADAAKLRAIAERAKVRDLNADVQLYRDAAAATDRGEAFYVQAADRGDLHVLIAGLVVNGIEQPTIDDARVG